MKKIYLVFLLMFLCVATCYAAKMNAYTEDTTPSRDDIVNTMDDPAGTQTTKKVTIANLLTAGQLGDLADVGATTATAGRILVGDGDSFESVAVSGDATLSAAGELDIADTIDGPVSISGTAFFNMGAVDGVGGTNWSLTGTNNIDGAAIKGSIDIDDTIHTDDLDIDGTFFYITQPDSGCSKCGVDAAGTTFSCVDATCP